MTSNDMASNVFYDRYIRSVLLLRERYREEKTRALPGGRTLVLSPHYDDEVIGAGGAVLTQIERGHRVRVVYLTDGRMGMPSIPDKALVEETRRAESHQALEILGVREVYHLSEPETMLRPGKALVQKLIPVVRGFAPEVVLVPWFFDNHVDHVEANRVLLSIVSELDKSTVILGYEVWTPLIPNLYLDITRFASKKRKALMCFASQLEQVDYIRTTMALGKRRALESDSGGYAEAFLCMRIEEYIDWIDRSGIAAIKFV